MTVWLSSNALFSINFGPGYYLDSDRMRADK